MRCRGRLRPAHLGALLLLVPFPLAGCQQDSAPTRPDRELSDLGAIPADAERSLTATRLVENGGFESPRVASRTYTILLEGDFIGPWLVEEGAVDLISRHFWTPARGRQSLDLDGTCGAGTISQEVHPVPGRSYLLRFALAGNPGGPPEVKALEVWWGSELLDAPSFDASGASYRHMGWTYREYVVTAASDNVLLRFRSLTPGCYGPALDDVTLREVARPLP